MSDWNAVYYPAAAINAGNDLAMPGPIGPEALTKAAEEGSAGILTNRNVSFRKALEERFAEVTLQRLAEDTDALIYNTACRAGRGMTGRRFLFLRQERFTEEMTVNVTVKNTGARAGKTVVQLYVSDVESALTKSVKELKAFRKVHLEPRESKIVSFTLGRHAFESYDPNLHTWTMVEGYYRISAGFSSTCIEGSCTVYADVESPYSYGANTSVKVLMEEVRLQETVKSFFAEKKLSWALMLTSYQYTAQDTIGQILETAGCTEADKRDLYGRLRLVEKR